MANVYGEIAELHQKLQEAPELFSAFEKQFIADMFVRYEKYGEDVFISDKQFAVLERTHKWRVIEGKPSPTLNNGNGGKE